MWSGAKSIRLSKVFVILFLMILLVTVFLGPWIVKWFFVFSRAELEGLEPHFLATIYVGSIPAFVLLICLYRLIRRIEADEVFIAPNVNSLRYISWSCFSGALICVISVFYYDPWIFVAVAAAFMGLIVRVVKNVFSQAVELKNESDFTI